MNALKFSRGLPTKPGWYWWRGKGGLGNSIEMGIFYVRDFCGELAIHNSTLKGWPTMERAEWAGPLPIPVPGKLKPSNEE